MKTTLYAYPWDFDDPAVIDRALELEVNGVAVAGNYHTSRVVSALHPTKRVRDVSHSALYVPVRADAWRGQRLIPSTPTWLDTDRSYLDAAEIVSGSGLDLVSWIVLTHHDELGYEHPDLVMRNAFDEPYSYALCPSHEDVRLYALTLVAEILSAAPSKHIVIEACGSMGFEHAGTHDKTEFADLHVVEEELLSLCFCQGCRHRYHDAGIDDVDFAKRVRGAIGTRPSSVEAVLGEELAAASARVRRETSETLQRAVSSYAASQRPAVSLTLHSSANPWATGSFPTLGIGPEELAAVVANCWDIERGVLELARLRSAFSALTLGAYVRADHVSVEDAPGVITSLKRAGADELHLYHLGLLSQQGLANAGAIVRAFDAGS